MKLKKNFLKIWNLSEKYQDFRKDKGHAESVTNFAIKLLESEKGDENIVIPAAILHDIGWSELSKEKRFLPFKEDMKRKERKVRIEHEKIGTKLAEKILKKVNYDTKLIPKIIKIIDGHDTRKKAISDEDKIVKDADKLWRYSKKGIRADINRGVNPKKLYQKRERKLKEKDFIFTKTAKRIAKRDLKKNKKEFGV